MAKPFTLGDFTFQAPGAPDDEPVGDSPEAIQQFLTQHHVRINGADPPLAFQGIAREAIDSLSSEALREGDFCGHMSPYTVFDIVIDGQDLLEMLVLSDEEQSEDDEKDAEGEALDLADSMRSDLLGDEESEPEPTLVLVRPYDSDGPWLVIFDREWDTGGSPTNIPGDPQAIVSLEGLTNEEIAGMRSAPCRVSIGFEYPIEAESVNDVSWIEIHAAPDDSEDVYGIVSREMM